MAKVALAISGLVHRRPKLRFGRQPLRRGVQGVRPRRLRCLVLELFGRRHAHAATFPWAMISDIRAGLADGIVLFFWKEVVQQMIAHTQAAGEEETRVVCAVVCGTRSALRRRCGFSGDEWIRAETAKRPTDLADGAGEPSSHEAAEGDGAFAARPLTLRKVARPS